MTYSEKITFVIFTYNEERRIERAIQNFSRTGRVLVVDNHSSDATRTLAESAGASVLLNKNFGWVEDERTAALVKATVVTPWIYWAYADEMVDSQTLEEIIAIVEQDKCSIISIVRKNYYYGSFCNNAYAHFMNRAFKKDAIDFTGNKIHHFGKITVAGTAVLRLDPSRYFVHHFISHTAKAYLRSLDGYSDTEPKHRTTDSARRTLYIICKTFVGNYLVRGGYKAGLPGFFVVVQQAYYTALLSMKTFEAEQNLTFETIEERNNRVRDRLLGTFK